MQSQEVDFKFIILRVGLLHYQLTLSKSNSNKLLQPMSDKRYEWSNLLIKLQRESNLRTGLLHAALPRFVMFECIFFNLKKYLVQLYWDTILICTINCTFL